MTDLIMIKINYKVSDQILHKVFRCLPFESFHLTPLPTFVLSEIFEVIVHIYQIIIRYNQRSLRVQSSPEVETQREYTEVECDM